MDIELRAHSCYRRNLLLTKKSSFLVTIIVFYTFSRALKNKNNSSLVRPERLKSQADKTGVVIMITIMLFSMLVNRVISARL